MLVGISAAAGLFAGLKVAERLGRERESVIVTILCDSGEKYLSERFWTET
jgi:cysteine synthase B